MNQQDRHRALTTDHTANPDLARPLFDAGFYREAYRTAIGDSDPFEHFMAGGWRFGFNPNPFFDTRHYLTANPDVAAAGINPLLHYAMTGAAEGRSSVRRVARTLQAHVLGATAPSKRAKDFGAAADRREPMDVDTFEHLLRTARSEAGPGRIISVSHDRYRVFTGGIQSLIAVEEEIFVSAGFGYLHLAPAAPLPLLAEADTESAAFVVTLNGRDAGVVRLGTLLHILTARRNVWPDCRLIVHHLMSHAPEWIAAIAAHCGPGRPIVWIHDFFSLCPSYALLRNDVAFCGAPEPTSGECGVCVYGGDRQSHLTRIRALFEALRPDVVAPSESALRVWQETGGLPHAMAHVLPHARLAFGESEPAPVAHRGSGPMRVAFVGTPLVHKGWYSFEALAHRHFEDPRYEFYLFAVWSEGGRGVRHVPVEVLRDNRNAMVDALCRTGIDVVVNWTLCHETFSLTTTEALAAGCYVLVRRGSGNAWAQVRALGADHGAVLDSQIELQALFVSGEIIERAHRKRPSARIVRSRGTADLILPEVRT